MMMTMIVQEEINFLSIEIHCKEYVCGLNGKIFVLFLFFFYIKFDLDWPQNNEYDDSRLAPRYDIVINQKLMKIN